MAEYMAQQGLDDDAVAAAIGCSRPTVSRIRRRKQRPDWPTIEKLKTWSGGILTADDFQELEAEASAGAAQ